MRERGLVSSCLCLCVAFPFRKILAELVFSEISRAPKWKTSISLAGPTADPTVAQQPPASTRLAACLSRTRLATCVHPCRIVPFIDCVYLMGNSEARTADTFGSPRASCGNDPLTPDENGPKMPKTQRFFGLETCGFRFCLLETCDPATQWKAKEGRPLRPKLGPPRAVRVDFPIVWRFCSSRSLTSLTFRRWVCCL